MSSPYTNGASGKPQHNPDQAVVYMIAPDRVEEKLDLIIDLLRRLPWLVVGFGVIILAVTQVIVPLLVPVIAEMVAA